MKTAVISVPRIEPHRPPPGAAIVARICQTQGHEVTVYDLNIKMYRRCQELGIDFHSLDPVFDRTIEASPEQQELFNNFISYWSNQIAATAYDYVMISVFSFPAQHLARLLLIKLKELLPQTKFLVGGMGVGAHSLLDSNKCFGQDLLDEQLIDAYIVGEAENALVTYLSGGTGPGINNNQIEQIQNLDSLPTPDYSYFNLDEYDYLTAGEREVFITSSRGCVRKCTYCDVERYWPKYRFRSGTNVAAEIIDNYERNGITRFYFTDSLVNGSLRVFSDMCETLAAYKFEQPIHWSGQFIFRPERSIPKDHFKLISAAGGRLLYVGIETGSDRVRREMGKNFTNEDADFQFEQCSQNNIQVIPLMFTGYLTETIQDHYDNLDAFRRWQKFVANGTITGVELGSNLVILPGSPVERMIESHGIDFMLDSGGEPNKSLWYARTNPDLTIRERIRRKLEVHYTAIKYAWPVWRQTSRLREFKDLIIANRLHEPETKKFFHIQSIDNGKKVLSEMSCIFDNA